MGLITKLREAVLIKKRKSRMEQATCKKAKSNRTNKNAK